jgi:hypothetical protein
VEGGKVADAASGEMEINTTAMIMGEAVILIITMVRLKTIDLKNIDLNIIIMRLLLLLLQGETRR